uniref:Zinc finger CCCH domain-containing protein 27 n=1 Tax=Anthurium amnicola TaxID=1678845 RepID=A0A1D1XTC9_9ARAE
MKFEESSLTGYLVKHLEPLTEADPTILAEYAVALLKKDKSIQELQKLCIDNLVEFLGHGTKSFVSELFKAFEDGTIIRPVETFDDIGKSDPSPITDDPVELKSSPPKEENPSTSSRPVSDSEDKEVSDDEDDDRNHKHRRRDNRPQTLGEETQEQFARRSNRNRNRLNENGQLFAERDPQSVEIHKEYSPSLERDLSSSTEKRRPVLAPAFSTADLGQKNRIGRIFRSSNGPRFDLSVSSSRPPVGGRGRGTGPWSQHDSRFNPLDALSFTPQMNSQVPSLLGAGLSSAASTQSTSWGAYGFIPGVPNGCLEPLHPLSLQGALHPPLNTLNISMPLQRCRDFEERGFCLRGDMCPMEHGVNRIVVEDVQSLSQFNLSVSLPSTSILGTQAAAVSLPSITSSNLLGNSKSVPSKSTNSMVNDDGLGVSGVMSVSAGGGEADVYDPDQPLWNSDHPETSNACLMLPSPKIEGVESMWEAGSSDHQGYRFSASIVDERPSSISVGSHGSQGTASSVWGRIGSGSKFGSSRRIDNAVTPACYLGKKTKEEQEEVMTNAHIKHATTGETSDKAAKFADVDSGRKPGRGSQKAQRTLFVNGIPQKSNRRDALLLHFQKFGAVIDIYIPLNSEKAFVQFSKREEAEAALKAPDAVMGNRFIKLWWANRDNIADGESRVPATPVATRSTAMLSVRPQISVSDKGGETRMPIDPKSSSAATDGSVPVTTPSKTATVAGLKATPSLQSKVENLELLKEALRRKQESLAQKRNDFKRQLDKLEKQALSANKAEIVTDRAMKKQKIDPGAEVIKISTPKPTNANTVGMHQQPEKAHDKGISGDTVVSPSSKVSSTILQQSPRSLKATNYTPALFVNRFKLDNRPTAFRIMPPLPADLANVAALKEHFSAFGDLVTAELEHKDSKSYSAGLKPPPTNCSAVITFATRRSAEKAFNTAKCWQGHSLQFAWLMSTSSTNCGHGTGEISANPTREGTPDAEVQPKPLQSGLSSSRSDTPNSNISPERGGDTGRGECAHIEQASGPELLTNDLVQVSPSCPVSMSYEERPPISVVPMVEDDINVSPTQ